MALCTYIQMVDDRELATLKKDPARIMKLNQSGAKSYATHFFCSVTYFLTGAPWGNKKHVLSGSMYGNAKVVAPLLENGSFGVVQAKDVAKMAGALAKVDLMKLKTRVAAADWESLSDEEVDDAELLQEGDDPAAEVTGEVKRLVSFYASAAKKKLNVVMYTT